jgi:ABC-type branched-subunit amino acid transport system ATPase component
LRKAFGGQVVLDGVSAELREGEVVLLRGDNGSGKTTLLNILSGNLEPDAGSIHLEANGTTEHFEFPRKWWQDLNPFDHFTPERVAHEGVGRTWQDVRLFGTLSLADNIAVATPRQPGENPLNVLFGRGSTMREESGNIRCASERLGGLGLHGRDQSSADRISLGQTKRVAIARAVQAGARILFLDEPLAGLDAEGIASVLELLRELGHHHRVTLVIVEHVFNIPSILGLADTVWTLQDGEMTVQSPAAVQEQHSEMFAADIVSWVTKTLGHETTVTIEPLLGGAVLTKLSKPRIQTQNSESKVLEVSDLVVRRGKRLVIGRKDSTGALKGLSFSIGPGEIAILQAPNGWGKTSLFEALTGIIPLEAGRIHLEKLAIENMPAWERSRHGLRYLRAQSSAFPTLPAHESLRLAGRLPNNALMPDSLLARTVSSLSGGEKQRLALSCHPRSAKCHLLDEPFSALDAKSLAAWNFFEELRCDTEFGIMIALPNTAKPTRQPLNGI